MSVNRYAAHYMLSPDGKLVRWPVISVRDDGCIESVECFEECFVERPFTRFFSGVLCPAFVDVYSDVRAADISMDKLSLNRHFRDGTLVLGVRGALDVLPEALTRWPRLVQMLSGKMEDRGQSIFPGQGTLLERMKNQGQRPLSLLESLSVATARGAELGGISMAGRLEKGYSPGLLLLQNIDLVNLAWTPRASVKWLNVPERLES
jgi:hypothetical protein